LIGVSGPPVNHRQLPYFECSSGRVLPILDVIWTALQLGNMAALGAQSDAEFSADFQNNDPPFSRKTAMGLNVAFAALGGFSAYYGFTKTGECRTAKNELILRMNQGGMGPAPGTWPPQPGGYPQGQPVPPQGTWPPPAQPAPPAPAPEPMPAPAPAPAPAPPAAPAPY
jgi:hypothetical protein